MPSDRTSTSFSHGRNVDEYGHQIPDESQRGRSGPPARAVVLERYEISWACMARQAAAVETARRFMEAQNG